jgi:hypothetical protein
MRRKIDIGMKRSGGKRGRRERGCKRGRVNNRSFGLFVRILKRDGEEGREVRDVMIVVDVECEVGEGGWEV